MPTDPTTVPDLRRPLHWPVEPAQGGWYTPAEHAALAAAADESADWRTGWKPTAATVTFEEAFAGFCGSRYAVACNSGGSALDMVLDALALRPGEEVISCAINFVGPHLAVIRHGGQLVLAEPDATTLNLDAQDLARHFSARTRAILITHWNGAVADLAPYLEVAAWHPHPVHGPPVVIVDAARACGGRDSAGVRVGAGGQAWATVFSFESKKLMTTLGQGGIVTTSDPVLADRLRRARGYGGLEEWGTNRLMTKAQAKVGLIQLARLDAMNDARVETAHTRTAALADVAELTMPPPLSGKRHLYYRHNLLVPESWGASGRDALMDTLANEYRVGSIISDPPTYRSHRLIADHTHDQRCPRADALADRLLCPILHPQLSEEEQTTINTAIRAATADVARTRPTS
ncbi:aminotransferase class I/II-fold pyridoxal phosphate-dependent enzyme [Streptomyces angustmyceticus]